jgi:hypothetical protein
MEGDFNVVGGGTVTRRWLVGRETDLGADLGGLLRRDERLAGVLWRSDVGGGRSCRLLGGGVWMDGAGELEIGTCDTEGGFEGVGSVACR